MPLTVTTGQGISITGSSSAWGRGLTGVTATAGVIIALSAPAVEDTTVVDAATTVEEVMAAVAMAVVVAMAVEAELAVVALVAEDAVVVADSTVAAVAMVAAVMAAVVTANSEQLQIRHGGASTAPPCCFYWVRKALSLR